MKFRILSFVLYWFTRLVGATVRLQAIGEDQVAKLQQDTGCGVVLVTWHGRTLIPITHFRKRGYWSMISTSRDGELQAELFRRYGFQIVRGSSSARGSIQATLTIVRQLKAGGILAHTPDGPRGPSHTFHAGAVFMAHRANCPIIPVGISAYPRKLARSWDRYLIPLPFSKAVMLYGEPVTIPPEANQSEQEEWSRRLGLEIDRLEAEADRLVGVKE